MAPLENHGGAGLVSATLDEAQLRTQVAAVRSKLPDARRIGVFTRGPWSGPTRLRVGQEEADVVFCDSTLAVREALVSHEHDDRVLVVLTPCEDRDLGADVLARLAKRRLLRSDPWQNVMALFRARDVDPRIARERWMASALLEAAPPEGPPPAPSGMLDAEHAWGVLFNWLRLPSSRPDARTLLVWALDEASTARFRAGSEELRRAAADWIAESAGRLAPPILAGVEAGRGADGVAIGLACRAIFDPTEGQEPRLRDAAIRLEPLAGGKPIDPSLGLAWAEAAETAVRTERGAHREAALRMVFDRAAEILGALGIGDEAWRSAVIPLGFEQRLERFAAAAETVLAGRGDLGQAQAAGAMVLTHELAAESPRRRDAVVMALRLLRWLAAGADDAPKSLAEAVDRYAADGSFVDWAREGLADGDPVARISALYGALVQRATERRERQNQVFARLLGAAGPAGAPTGVLPIESVLEQLVAPLAAARPVLLLVLDGMSQAVHQELARDLVEEGWCEIAPRTSPARVRALAALPTVTEVSRTSLLCGTLRRGTGVDEKAGFETHAALRSACRAGQPPVLFHKADLVAPGGVGLSEPVREAVANTSRRVVGVVLNAVDDFLAKGDHIHPRWGIAAIRPLEALLEIARSAGRAIVLTSDHGHVLERGTSLRREAAEGSRFRADDGHPDDGEVVMRGPRAVGVPGGSFIAAWSERIRYGPKQNGYHGGVSPQEVVIPLAAFAPLGEAIEGWVELPPELPAWWESEPPPQATVAPPVPAPPSPPKAGQMPLPLAGPSPVPAAEPPWIGALFASSVYGTQKRLAARTAPPDGYVKAALLALDARGGKLTRSAFARAVGLPPARVSGFLAALRRVLNVEGYPVLSLQDEDATVELNRELLRVQFGIGE